MINGGLKSKGFNYLEMKHICHITVTHQTFDTRIFRKECLSLIKAGYKVTLIAPHDREETVDGVKILPVLKWKSFLERIDKVPRTAIKLAQKLNADLYHFHDPELLPHMRAFAIRTKSKVVWDAHENYRDTIWQLNSLKIKPLSWLGARWFGQLELNAAKKNFAGVVTITEKMGRRYKREGVNTCILANYADVAKFNYKGDIQLTEKPSLISSGSHFRGRAAKEIASSFPIIRSKIDANLVFCGRFTEQELEQDVRSILQSFDPSGRNWKVEGAVSFDYLINKAIPRAWAGLVLFDLNDPNNRNGLPNRFFECWANGVPVIATRDTQVALLVEKYKGGIVIPENTPEAIANAFYKIASNPALRAEMSKNAFDAVKIKYNWDKNFKDLEAFYQNILFSK